MFNYNRSGQFLYFSLVSVFSGNAVTGASGAISGRRCIDGGTMNLFSGNIVEDAGGMYHVNLYDFDTNGRNIGCLITSSGCALVSLNLTTTGGVSGNLFTASGTWPASGANVVVPPASLSGVVANSGLNVTVPVASISGVYPASGSMSGQPTTPLSGLVFLGSGTTFQATITSGQIWLASGQSTLSVSGAVYLASGTGGTANSGLFVTVPTSTLSGIIANSGLFVSVPIASISGVFPASGSMSGQPVYPVSGQVYIASGTTFQATITSGTIYLASGQLVSLNSGQSVLVYSGQLSGQPIAGLSGVVYPASGLAVISRPWSFLDPTLVRSASGIMAGATNNTVQVVSGGSLSTQDDFYVGCQFYAGFDTNGSGQKRTVTKYVAATNTFTIDRNWALTPISGTSYIVYAENSPELNSGAFVNIPIATISGATTASNVTSGSLYLASGSLLKNTFASGVLTQEIPYDVLKADMSGVTGEAIHSLINAARKLTNKWDTSSTSGFLTVYKEDAATAAYQQSLTSQSGAQPVIALGDA